MAAAPVYIRAYMGAGGLSPALVFAALFLSQFFLYLFMSTSFMVSIGNAHLDHFLRLISFSIFTAALQDEIYVVGRGAVPTSRYPSQVAPVTVSNSYIEVAPRGAAAAGFTFTNPGIRRVCISPVSVPQVTHAEMHVTELNGVFTAVRTVDRLCARLLSVVRFGSLTHQVMSTGNVDTVRKGAVIQLTLDDGRVVEVKTPLGPVPASRSRD
jgi:copper(I)-binding protein